MPKTNKTDKQQHLNDHDIFVKGILSITELVHRFLTFKLPDSLKPFIDFSTLKLLSDTHIDKRLKATYSDTIHECLLKREMLPAHIRDLPELPHFRFCFLWEHKSSKPHEPIEFQIEDYRRSIIRSDLKNKRPPSIVLPILIYHGKDAWHQKMLFERMAIYLPDEIMAFVPFPKYIVLDLQATTDAEIEQMADLGVLQGVFIALKHAHERDFFRNYPNKILNFVEGLSSKYLFDEIFRMILEYMQRRSDLPEKEFNEIIDKLEPDMSTKFKTIFEVAEEKSFEKGLATRETEANKAKAEANEAKAEANKAKAEANEAKAEANEAKTQANEMRGAMQKAVVALIQTTDWSDSQIAEIVGIDEGFVKNLRLAVKPIPKKKK